MIKEKVELEDKDEEWLIECIDSEHRKRCGECGEVIDEAYEILQYKVIEHDIYKWNEEKKKYTFKETIEAEKNDDGYVATKCRKCGAELPIDFCDS